MEDRNSRSVIRLRVEPHPRGHIASCNGNREQVAAFAEPCAVGLDSRNKALAMEERMRREREKKRQKILDFQRRMKKGLSQKEKAWKQMMAENASKAVECEQKAVEKLEATNTLGLAMEVL